MVGKTQEVFQLVHPLCFARLGSYSEFYWMRWDKLFMGFDFGASYISHCTLACLVGNICFDNVNNGYGRNAHYFSVSYTTGFGEKDYFIFNAVFYIYRIGLLWTVLATKTRLRIYSLLHTMTFVLNYSWKWLSFFL